MFNKIIISDDLVSISEGVYTTAKSLNIENVTKVQYCDDAYLKIKEAHIKGVPFEMIISDLSFVKDHRDQMYPSGEALIEQLSKEFPELKIIVYSVEDRLGRLRYLINDLGVKGYVCKGRKGLTELKEAIQIVHNNLRYVSPHLEAGLHSDDATEITDFDIKLLKLLSEGFVQTEISVKFKSEDIKPNSVSTIEKRLVKLRDQFRANNVIQLVSIAKDMGLI